MDLEPINVSLPSRPSTDPTNEELRRYKALLLDTKAKLEAHLAEVNRRLASPGMAKVEPLG
jgi:hypothetical protein